MVSEAEEAALVASLARLELKPFEFHGHLGNRRVAAFGLRYDYAQRSVQTADRFPSFLADLRYKVAKFAGRGVDEFQQGGVNEYPRSWYRLAQGQVAIWCDRWRFAFSASDDALSSQGGKSLGSYVSKGTTAIDLHTGR